MAYIELKNIENTDYFYQEAIKTLRTNLQFCGSSVPGHHVYKHDAVGGKKLNGVCGSSINGEHPEKGSVYRCGHPEIHDGKDPRDHRSYLRTFPIFKRSEDPGRNRLYDKCRTSGCGPRRTLLPKPGELLEDPTFKTMIDWARERYDYVVIDTPPMMNLIDAAIIAERQTEPFS